MIHAAELIERKRDGEELAADELSELVLGYARGEVPDYQMAAFCMAVYFRGLNGAETFALTDAMIRSGETIDLGAALGRKVVDKHSTGGVGDKTSIAVGPIVAACGVPFGKMSGRGLGHTGGTLDKLESIPGFRVELTTEEFVAQVREVGLAIIGQTADLVPADKQLYALRDVTATVDNVSLIAASIMSKKIAAGADAIVLDVKVGDGAFMKTLDDARELAETMLELGRHAGREVVCLLTDMDQPLGHAVGNALEIREAIATLRGEGPPDFTELVLDACAHLLALSDLGIDEDEGARARRGGGRGRLGARDVRALDRGAGRRPGRGRAARARPSSARSLRRAAGYVRALGAIDVGIAALHLGAGRRTKEDAIDHAVGVVCLTKRGDAVAAGDVLAEVHARDEASAQQAAAEVLAAYELGDERRRATADRARDDRLTARAARGRDDPAQLEPHLVGRRFDRGRDRRPAADAAVRAGRGRGRARGRARVGARAPRQVSDCPVRDRAGSPDPPPDDGEPAARGERQAWPTTRIDALLSGSTTDRTSRTATCAASARGCCSSRASSSRTSPTASASSRSGARSRRDGSAERLAGRRAPVKAALLDQRTVAGLGNIYVDEALWRAQVHPLRPAGTLDEDELARLTRAIKDALKTGIARQGATLRDYSTPTAGGVDAGRFRVYGRDGEPCHRCGTPIEKIRAAGRGTWYCPTCQRLDAAQAASSSSRRPSRSSRQSSV